MESMCSGMSWCGGPLSPYGYIASARAVTVLLNCNAPPEFDGPVLSCQACCVARDRLRLVLLLRNEWAQDWYPTPTEAARHEAASLSFSAAGHLLKYVLLRWPIIPGRDITERTLGSALYY